MRTARSSSRRGGLHQVPPRPEPHPPEQATPRAGTPRDQTPQNQTTGPGTPHGQTHTCKHITLPQTLFAGGKYIDKIPIQRSE